MYQNRRYYLLLPIEKSEALVFLLLHQAPLVPTLSLPDRECQIQASLKSLCHAWFLRILHCASCFSTIHLNKSHLLQRSPRTLQEYLSGRPYEHRLRLAILAFVQSLFPVQWQQRVNPAKTSVKFWTTLSGLNVKVTSLGSIRNHNCYNASFLIGQSKVLNNHSVSTSIALSY